VTLRSYVLYNGTAIVRMFTIKNRVLLFFYCNRRKGITCVLVMECETCKKTFSRKANLKRHEEKCKVVFKCEECDLKPCKITAISDMGRSGEICLSINHPGY
jgi:hypothetical protein